MWYDKIAVVYDFFTSAFYKKARIELIDNLNIKENNVILVVACGTGQSFKYIEKKLNGTGEIIAIDYSEGMLKKAQKLIEKNNWTNIKLIKMDARNLSKEFLTKNNINNSFDVIIGELAFSVIPEWKNVMKICVDLLNANGKIGILDWYRPKNNIITKIVDFIAEAETTRKTGLFAQTITNEFKIIRKYFFKSFYVGIGNK